MDGAVQPVNNSGMLNTPISARRSQCTHTSTRFWQRALRFLTGCETEAAADILPLLEAASEDDFWGALPVLSMQLREALERMESGREQPLDVTAALLDRIFPGFCIGK